LLFFFPVSPLARTRRIYEWDEREILDQKLLHFHFRKKQTLTHQTAVPYFSDRPDVTYPPMIETINLLEPNAEYLAPGDRIHQIDGISTVGLTNEQVINLLLCNREEIAVIEIEYSLPDYRECR
jgi:hypothetical protein